MAGSGGDERIREIILDRVPVDGSVTDDDAFFESLAADAEGATSDDCRRVRDLMLAEGMLVRAGGGGKLSKLRRPGSASGKSPAKTQGNRSSQKAEAYRHRTPEAVQRPDAGVEEHFSKRKPPKSYKYDSSLAPELCWDENVSRDLGEWLIELVAKAAELGEAEVFAKPQVWKGSGEQFDSLSECTARLRSLTKPFLNWAGKAERHHMTVPTLPLFLHERHSTEAILETLKSHRVGGVTEDLFADAHLDPLDKIDAYEHKGPWTNRLVLGDSLQVMNSLLEYEGMGGQVQMIYFDPPYGVKFGSNFQPFVRKNSVKHGSDDEMIREPEMVKAFRDTWELGLHSYLTYIRDRVMLARELLTDSGSLFVQISDDNIHHVREVLDEVFIDGFVSQISFKTTSGFESSTLTTVGDFLLWYSKDRTKVHYNKIYQPQPIEPGKGNALQIYFPDGQHRGVTAAEKRGEKKIPEGARLYKPGDLQSQGAASVPQPFDYEGKTYRPGPNSHWKANYPKGMERLAAAGRIHVSKNSIQYRRFADDFPFQLIGNIWTDTTTGNFSESKIYVVQTSTKVIERCMHMTTEPGDLVLDITCGSGSTPVVAEQWGRRWIAVDTSRVPIAIARQRLLTRVFYWYRLTDQKMGPAGGFVYQQKLNSKGEQVGGLVPRITLRSIANDEEPKTERLVERAEVTPNITRVCGPFTVEATVQAAMDMDEERRSDAPRSTASNPRDHIDRMIGVLRQSERLNARGNAKLEVAGVRPLADCEYLHAECKSLNGEEQRIAISFGPEDSAISSQMVLNAAGEAMRHGFQQLFLFGFAIQAKARESLGNLGIPATYVDVAPDVSMSDLLKTSRSSEIFSITGLPDISLEKAGTTDDGAQEYRVSIRGLDIFRPDTMETEAVPAENLPCWMLDADYNGMAFYATQVFFPKTSAWNDLQKSLKGQFEESVWTHLAGTVSEPFCLGEQRRIAVKAINDRGNELMAVLTEDEAT